MSSTHIAVGAIFGVGFLREAIKFYQIKNCNKNSNNTNEMKKEFEADKLELKTLRKEEEELMKLVPHKKKESKQNLTRLISLHHEIPVLTEKVSSFETFKMMKKEEKLVKRSAMWKIAAAWVITVPMSGVIAGLFFLAIIGATSTPWLNSFFN